MFQKTLIGLVLVLAAAAAGCNSIVSNDAEERAKLAAFAGRIDYPTAAPTGTLSVGSLISSDKLTLRIVNFSGRPLTDVDVWVNRQYVQHLDSVGPGATADLQANKFYNKSGTYMGQNGSVRIDAVQMQEGNTLYNVLGPANQ